MENENNVVKVIHDTVEFASMDFDTGLIELELGKEKVLMSFDELEVLYKAYKGEQ